jgi:hypothetical protein
MSAPTDDLGSRAATDAVQRSALQIGRPQRSGDREPKRLRWEERLLAKLECTLNGLGSLYIAIERGEISDAKCLTATLTSIVEEELFYLDLRVRGSHPPSSV